MVSVTQPDEFFPWLAKYVGAAGPFGCEEAVAGETGTLTFFLRHGAESLSVVWRVTERCPGHVPFRDGSVSVAGGEGLDPRVRNLALRQVLSRLEMLVQRRRPGLIERRNREVHTLYWSPALLETLCGDLLRANHTRCGVYKLHQVAFGGDRLTLAFKGVGPDFALQVRPREAAEDEEVLGTYGPVRLDGAAHMSDAASRVARYVGYVLALSTHEGMRLEVRGERTEAGGTKDPLGDKTNPFLFDGFSCGTIVMTAMFASRGRVVPVLHADRECAGFASYLTGLTETVYLPQAGMRPSFDYLRRMRIVDTSELDAVMLGCQSKLTRLIQQSAEEHDPELMIVMGTCVSRVIGDDVATAVEEAGVQGRGVPTLWLETTATERDQHHRILWDRLVELFQNQAPPSEEASVNLLGYGYWRTESLRELKALLEEGGIRHNASLIPSFEIEELRRFGAARLNVVYPSVHIRDSLLWVRDKLSAPTLEAPAPFGLRGTRAWLDAVLSFFGRPPVTDDWMAMRLGTIQDRWECLRKEASSVRAAIVLTSDHFGSTDPLARHGLPWFAVLQEMGFALDLFVIPAPAREEDPRLLREALARAHGVLDGRSEHRVTSVDSCALLPDALRSCGARLLYSEVPQDRHATTVGLTPMSLLDFRMGFEGACRTLERLLHLSRVPFHRRYGAYLPRPEWPA